MAPSLVVENVTKRWGEVVAVNGVSVEMRRSELVALLGPNGAGKSTLLNIVAGVVPPDSGRVEVCGIDVWKKPREAKKLMGFAPQDGGFNPNATVLENAKYVANLFRCRDSSAIRRILEELGLWGLRNRLVRKLSGGERKKLSIALSLLHDPPVLVLDEPTSGLDPGARRSLIDLLRKLVASGKLIVFSTHIGSDAEHADRIVVMHRGRVVLDSTPSEAKARVFKGSRIVEVVVEGLGELVAKEVGGEYVEGLVRLKCVDVDECIDRVESAASKHRARVVEVRIREPSIDDLFVEVTGSRLG